MKSTNFSSFMKHFYKNVIFVNDFGQPTTKRCIYELTLTILYFRFSDCKDSFKILAYSIFEKKYVCGGLLERLRELARFLPLKSFYAILSGYALNIFLRILKAQPPSIVQKSFFWTHLFSVEYFYLSDWNIKNVAWKRKVLGYTGQVITQYTTTNHQTIWLTWVSDWLDNEFSRPRQNIPSSLLTLWW